MSTKIVFADEVKEKLVEKAKQLGLKQRKDYTIRKLRYDSLVLELRSLKAIRKEIVDELERTYKENANIKEISVEELYYDYAKDRDVYMTISINEKTIINELKAKGIYDRFKNFLIDALGNDKIFELNKDYIKREYGPYGFAHFLVKHCDFFKELKELRINEYHDEFIARILQRIIREDKELWQKVKEYFE